MIGFISSARRAPARAAALALMFSIANIAGGTTIMVNSNSDAVGNDGVCTLREAIVAANLNAPSGGGAMGECAAGQALPTVDTIAFAIPGSGVHTIAVTSQMPQITQAVVIDGYTQSGATANTLAVGDNAALRVEIDGSGLAPGIDLFQFVGGGGSTVRGLVISHASQVFNIGIFTASINNTIAGNFIDTDPTGTLNQAVGQTAIYMRAPNTIGGTTPAARNVIGGGPGAATIVLEGDGNVIQGNYIGINAAGTALLQPAIATDGIELVLASNTTIGGAVPGAGNAIFANRFGIRLNFGCDHNVIQGNTIGTDAAGSTGLGGFIGITTSNNPLNTTIGGAAPGAGNLISGVDTGISPGDGTSTVIRGNKIGTDSTGTRAIPNSGNGITLSTPSAGSIIGGTQPGEGNTIAFNCGQGVFFSGVIATRWAMLGNSIHANGGLGISLNAGIPTPNDPGDGDTGANNLQNYPVITSAPISNGIAAISGTLNSTPNTNFRAELFAGDRCDPSGFGEGRSFIGFTNVMTNANGDASFGPLSLPVSSVAVVITATATDPDGNTSEFSQCFGTPDHLFTNGFELTCGGGG